MTIKAVFAASITLASCAVLCLGSAGAQTQDTQTSVTNTSGSAQMTAAQMAPAQATLANDLDARKVKPGQQFHAVLSGTVHLRNGVELPRGTVLVGTIAMDSMQTGAGSTLALRFTQADVKGGKVVPIEATIVGYAPPSEGNAWDYTDNQSTLVPWNGKSLQVDDTGVLSGVDLHSKIADNNSGVFVSKKKDMKLSANSLLSLAITVENPTGMSSGA